MHTCACPSRSCEVLRTICALGSGCSDDAYATAMLFVVNAHQRRHLKESCSSFSLTSNNTPACNAPVSPCLMTSNAFVNEFWRISWISGSSDRSMASPMLLANIPRMISSPAPDTLQAILSTDPADSVFAQQPAPYTAASPMRPGGLSNNPPLKRRRNQSHTRCEPRMFVLYVT